LVIIDDDNNNIREGGIAVS